jgi:hypothetical protein
MRMRSFSVSATTTLPCAALTCEAVHLVKASAGAVMVEVRLAEHQVRWGVASGRSGPINAVQKQSDNNKRVPSE